MDGSENPKIVLTSGDEDNDDDDKLSTGGGSSQTLSILTGGRGRPKALTVMTLKIAVGEMIDDVLKVNNEQIVETNSKNLKSFL